MPDIPDSPLSPVLLNPDDTFQFHCHKGISCFNACCKASDVTLMPYDILRLKRRFGQTSAEWVAQYTLPFPMDGDGMPGLKLNTKPGSRECVFLTEEGCSVYTDRPSACRYYALGWMGLRKQGQKQAEDAYFVVREDHCKGHAEKRRLTIREYLAEQGLEQYARMNRPWLELVLKKRSAGPTVGQPSKRSLQLFDMCSYDMDNFRAFIQTPGFKKLFALEADERRRVLDDEDRLFEFACRFLRQVLFGERSLDVRPEAAAERLERRKAAKPPPNGEL